MNNKKILFIPSNRNHVDIFSTISDNFKNNCDVLYISQESYKNEDAEKKLVELNLNFKRFKDYKKKDPKSILEGENVGVVVVGNDTDVIPQWFINCANELGIPSVLIQDGLMFDMKIARQGPVNHLLHILTHSKIKLLSLALRLFVTGKYDRITDGNSKCTQIHVWGTISESYFLSKGVNKTKIMVTGRPKPASTNSKLRKRGDDDYKIILYAPTEMVNTRIVTKTENEKLIDDLCSTISSLEKIKLVIKPHTGENLALYEKFKEKYRNKIDISNDNFYDLISNSDILITNISTTVIDALSFGKLVIIFFPRIDNIINSDVFPRDLIGKKIVLYAEDKETLRSEMLQVLDNKHSVNTTHVNDILEKYLGPLDTNGSARSANMIETLLNN